MFQPAAEYKSCIEAMTPLLENCCRCLSGKPYVKSSKFQFVVEMSKLERVRFLANTDVEIAKSTRVSGCVTGDGSLCSILPLLTCVNLCLGLRNCLHFCKHRLKICRAA